MKDIDEHILECLRRGYIRVDFTAGKIYTTRTLTKDGKPKEMTGHCVDGYIRIHLRIDYGSKTVKAHRIVWIAKNGPVKCGYHIDHINRDRSDNRLCNLRMVTPKINMMNRTSYKKRKQLNAALIKEQQKIDEVK